MVNINSRSLNFLTNFFYYNKYTQSFIVTEDRIKSSDGFPQFIILESTKTGRKLIFEYKNSEFYGGKLQFILYRNPNEKYEVYIAGPISAVYQNLRERGY